MLDAALFSWNFGHAELTLANCAKLEFDLFFANSSSHFYRTNAIEKSGSPRDQIMYWTASSERTWMGLFKVWILGSLNTTMNSIEGSSLPIFTIGDLFNRSIELSKEGAKNKFRPVSLTVLSANDSTKLSKQRLIYSHSANWQNELESALVLRYFQIIHNAREKHPLSRSPKKSTI